MATLNVFLVIFVIFISISGYLASDGTIDDDDLYEMALLNIIKQKQFLLNQKQEQLRQELAQLTDTSNANISPYKQLGIIENKKRAKGCIKRNAVCDGNSDNCCSGSTCRCTLIGSNCRCQRPGLFQFVKNL